MGLFYFIWGLEGCLLFLLLLRTCDSGQGLLVVPVGGSALSSPTSATGFSELSWATMSRNTCSLRKLRVFLGKCCYRSFSEMGSRLRWIKCFYPDLISVLEQSRVSLTIRAFSSEPQSHTWLRRSGDARCGAIGGSSSSLGFTQPNDLCCYLVLTLFGFLTVVFKTLT